MCVPVLGSAIHGCGPTKSCPSCAVKTGGDIFCKELAVYRSLRRARTLNTSADLRRFLETKSIPYIRIRQLADMSIQGVVTNQARLDSRKVLACQQGAR